MISIVFVCSGNICRSPMAHYYMEKRLYELGIEDKYSITSCGTQAINGDRATNDAIYTISKYNVNLINHKAINVKNIHLENADYIICMTKMHYDFVVTKYPEVASRVGILKKMLLKEEEYVDIDDPWGFDLNTYLGCAKEIVVLVDKLILKLESGEKI